jgi:hypothetical protein
MSDAQTLSRTDQAARQLELLGELAEIGLDIARAIERQVKRNEPEPSIAELQVAATAYARVARAVRQTILLQTRLLADHAAAAAKAGDLRRRVTDIVRQAIEDEHEDAEQVERLAVEAAEGLEQDRYGDVLGRPIADIVADICRDLGLHPDWRGLDREIKAVQAFARGAAGAAAPEPEDEDEDDMGYYWLVDGKLVLPPIECRKRGAGGWHKKTAAGGEPAADP